MIINALLCRLNISVSVKKSRTINYTTSLQQTILKVVIIDNLLKVNVLHIVPPVANLLTKSDAVKKFDLSSVEDVVVGAAPMKAELSHHVYQRFNLKLVRQGL